MRRQLQFGGAQPAGSGRISRLDPLVLPARFTASDTGADDRLRWVELDRDHVMLRRAVGGMPMAITLPMAAFSGIALRLFPPQVGPRVALSLEHRDPALTIPLLSTNGSDEAITQWQLWARTLNLPLLVADRDGTLREPFQRIGAVHVADVCPRRRRRNAIKARRPSMPLRRAPGRPDSGAIVHRGDREIIARN